MSSGCGGKLPESTQHKVLGLNAQRFYGLGS